MLAVPLAGSVEATGDPWLPFRVTDPCAAVVESVSAYFRDLQAAGRSDATLRSYGMDLLRWLRFLWAVEVAWNRATRIEARDFCRWMLVSGKPSRPHWRRPHEVPDRSSTAVAYSASVRAHAETVLRGFYEFHLAAGSGPIVNPFPLHRSRRGGRAYAHHNPMEPHRKERTGLYRPRVPSRIPRSIPDEEFNEIFARLPSNRDRALVAFYVSTGARASELLSAMRGDVDPGRQVIAVVRKGSRAVQELPPRPTRSCGCACIRSRRTVCWRAPAGTCATRSSTTCSPTCPATATPKSPPGYGRCATSSTCPTPPGHCWANTCRQCGPSTSWRCRTASWPPPAMTRGTASEQTFRTDTAATRVQMVPHQGGEQGCAPRYARVHIRPTPHAQTRFTRLAAGASGRVTGAGWVVEFDEGARDFGYSCVRVLGQFDQ